MSSLTPAQRVVLDTIGELEPISPREVEQALVGEDGDTEGLYIYPVVAELVVESRVAEGGDGLTILPGGR